MATKQTKPFKTLAVRYDAGYTRTSVFSLDDDLGEWIDPSDDTIAWHEFAVYGVPATKSALDEVWENDFTAATQIGKISGCHIPLPLIVNLGAEPYEVCDEASADLEAMYSALQESDDFDEDFGAWDTDIYYIHEIELEPEYQGLGYERILLKQLPAIIVKSLRVFPSLLMYYPAPTQHDEPERDEEAESILAHRLEYHAQNVLQKKDNIAIFPPKRDVPESEINRILGRRNPGDTVPEAHRDQSLYELYQSVGFKEIGQTGWLRRRIGNIFSEDGKVH